MNYMDNFPNRSYIKEMRERFKIEKPCIDKNTKRQSLYLEDPCILAIFAGYIKANEKAKVLFRGQPKDDGGMIPSLFRGNLTLDQLKNRYSAYCELINELPRQYNALRFQNESIGALLQHYGVRTPWLDLVDNLYTAIWFATKYIGSKKGEPIEYVDSENEFGWLHFISIKSVNGSELEWYDLREEHSSLSARLHVQHGISATRKNPVWNLTNRCLNDFVVASVKFPINKNWKLKGPLFNTEYMFPSTDVDNTYKYFKRDKFTRLIKSITDKYDLLDDELGTIKDYKYG